MGSTTKGNSRPTAVAILDGGRIVDELRRRGLTQSSFSRLTNIRLATVNHAISGHPLTAESIFRIAMGLAVTKVKS